MQHPLPPGWELKHAWVYTAADTWNKAAAIARGAVLVVAIPVGPGAQGGGGNSAAGFAQGGSGAGAGAVFPRWFFIGDLSATVAITVGGTTSGAGTEGINGADGTSSSFGAYAKAFGGGGGGTPSADGGAGGGPLAAGEGGFDAVARGGAPSWGTSHSVATTTVGFGGSSGGDETDNIGGAENLRCGVFGGPGGGCGSSGVAFKGGVGFASPGAGGAGGDQIIPLPGADGGSSGSRTDTDKAGHGGLGNTGSTGGPGTAGTTDIYTGLGTGGGGGAYNNAGNGGDGGAGGVPGGGGGGAGSGKAGVNVSGTGGAGGRGQVWVFEFGPPSTASVSDVPYTPSAALTRGALPHLRMSPRPAAQSVVAP